jgi:hypothetical protein
MSARIRCIPCPGRADRDPKPAEIHDMGLSPTCNRFLRAGVRTPTKIRWPGPFAALDPARAKVINMTPKRA